MCTDLYKQYNVAFDKKPFSQTTTELGEELVNNIFEHRKEIWQEFIEKTDVTHSSRKAWKTIKILSNDYALSKEKANVTANQVAHQLIKNRKSPIQKKEKLTSLPETDNSIISDPFTLRELETGMQQTKEEKQQDLMTYVLNKSYIWEKLRKHGSLSRVHTTQTNLGSP